MRRLILLLLLNFVIAIDLFAISYPSWFLYPKKYPKYITGFSYQGNPPSMDAEVMYCVFKHCDVDGYLESYSDGQFNFLSNAKYYYVYPTEEIERISGKLNKIDRFVLSVRSGDYVELFSFEKDEVFVSTLTEEDSIPRPSWLNKNTWQDGEYYYGVSMTTSIGNPSDCWKNSEEQAVFSILTSLSMKFYSLNFSTSNNQHEKEEFKQYTRTELKFAVSSIQTLERYPDLQKNLFYTLVRIPKRSVRPLSFDPESK